MIRALRSISSCSCIGLTVPSIRPIIFGSNPIARAISDSDVRSRRREKSEARVSNVHRRLFSLVRRRWCRAASSILRQAEPAIGVRVASPGGGRVRYERHEHQRMDNQNALQGNRGKLHLRSNMTTDDGPLRVIQAVHCSTTVTTRLRNRLQSVRRGRIRIR